MISWWDFEYYYKGGQDEQDFIIKFIQIRISLCNNEAGAEKVFTV